MFNKMLVIVFIIDIDFYSGYGPGSQKPSISICAHFYHSVLEMGQVLVLELTSPEFPNFTLTNDIIQNDGKLNKKLIENAIYKNLLSIPGFSIFDFSFQRTNQKYISQSDLITIRFMITISIL